jgi:hypothetical protein
MNKNLFVLLRFSFLDALIGMATASCVIGVTILKSKEVNSWKYFLKDSSALICRFHYIIWSFWKSLHWWLMLDFVRWDLVNHFDILVNLLLLVTRSNTLDIINGNVFSIRTCLCFSDCDYSELVIHVLYNHDLCSTFCK